MRALISFAAVACVCVITGCNSAPAAHSGTISVEASSKDMYPARPRVAPPAFKVFHHDASSITLVTKEDATDTEIESLIWELHDAAQSHSFNKLKIDPKWVDARDPMMWFHIYRGTKCASEKYASGKPPCGDSYHAAGDYTLGGFTNHNHDDGVLLQGDDRQTELWNADATANSSKQGAAQ